MLAIVLLLVDALACLIEFLVESLALFGGQLPIGLHPRLILPDLCFPRLELSGLFGCERAAIDALLYPALLVLHTLLDDGVVDVAA
jgi:hypothetical protein